MKYLIALTTALFSIASVAWAGIFNPDNVSVEARWVVHLDVEALTSSEFGACLIKGLQSQEENPLTQMEAEIGINPLEDIYSLTAYGTGEPPAKGISVEVTGEDVSVGAVARPGGNAVVLAVMSDAIDALIQQLAADEQRYEKISRAGYTIHSWADEDSDARWYLYQQPIENESRRLVLASDNSDALFEGIRVLAGDAPSLADVNRDDRQLPQPGSMLFASVDDIGDLAGHEAASELLKRTKRLAVDLVEHEGTVILNISAQTDSPEAATTITQIIQGALAVATLAVDPNDDEAAAVKALVQNLNFTTEGRRMSLEFQQPAEVLCQLLEAAGEGLQFGEGD
ncbi:MAG: hypothetical protein V3T53_12035 [Phycisphaerales bacterium]